MKTATFSFLFVAAMPLLADTPWTRLPLNVEMPVNMASNGLEGVSIHSAERVSQAENLLSEDATVGTVLPAGRSEVVVKLAAQQVAEMARFMNDGTEGRIVVLGSTDASDWELLGRVTFGTGRRTVETRFGGGQGRFVKLIFDLARAGTIRAFKLYGPSDVSDWEVVSGERAKAAEHGDGEAARAHTGSLNWAGGFDDARPIYAHPTPKHLEARRFTENLYEFPSVTEPCRTVVYDLGRVRAIKHFSTAYSLVPTRVEVFVFSNLPEKTDWREKTTLDPAVFDLVDPVATGVDAAGIGNMKHVPEGGVTGRYIAVRFRPMADSQTAWVRRDPGASLAAVPVWKSTLASLSGARGLVAGFLERGLPEIGPRFVAAKDGKKGGKKSDDEGEAGDDEDTDETDGESEDANASNSPAPGEFEATIEIADESNRGALRSEAGGTPSQQSNNNAFPSFGIFSITSSGAVTVPRPLAGTVGPKSNRPRNPLPIVRPPAQNLSPSP